MRVVRMLLCALAASCAIQSQAHHSGAMFDRLKTIELKGVVKAYQYTNPHAWIRVLVTDEKGNTVEWGIEGGSPRLMAGWGITPEVIRPGDEISIRTHPLRDGRPGGALVDVTLANGKVLKTLEAHPEVGKPRF